MNRKLVVISFSVFLLINPAMADNLELNISVDIIAHEYTDAFVVGDFFYYRINLTNPMSEKISDNFSVSVFNPADALIEPMKNYNDISIESGQSIEIIAKGGYENETATFPFDVAGDYKIMLESTKPIDFYRWVEVGSQNGYKEYRFVRINKKYVYYFDVMPKWQYNLWKEEEKINEQSLDLSQKMFEITNDMGEATQEMKNATQYILGATLIMLIVAIFTLKATRKKN